MYFSVLDPTGTGIYSVLDPTAGDIFCIRSSVHCKPGRDLNSHWLEKIESGSTESNVLYLGPIQVRKCNETGKIKCA
jgi:hypothetical protein